MGRFALLLFAGAYVTDPELLFLVNEILFLEGGGVYLETYDLSRLKPYLI
jgi:hypothetical protein